jgi:hypothetical protein
MGLRRRITAIRINASKDEKSSTLVLSIVLMALIFTAFGLGFDLMRNTWLRASLNNDLDQAVTAAAAVTTVNTNGTVVIDTARAIPVLEQTYWQNRNRYGGLLCPVTNRFVAGRPGELKCWFDFTGPRWDANRRGVTYTIRDSSRNFWGAFWGRETQIYEMTSRAVLRTTGSTQS